jgi:hypothetical protein
MTFLLFPDKDLLEPRLSALTRLALAPGLEELQTFLAKHISDEFDTALPQLVHTSG